MGRLLNLLERYVVATEQIASCWAESVAMSRETQKLTGRSVAAMERRIPEPPLDITELLNAVKEISSTIASLRDFTPALKDAIRDALPTKGDAHE